MLQRTRVNEGAGRRKLAATARIAFAHVADNVWKIDTQLIYLLEDTWQVLKDLLRAESGLEMLSREERHRMNRVGGTGVGGEGAEGEAGMTTSFSANSDAAGAQDRVHMRCESALQVRGISESQLSQKIFGGVR